MRPVALIIGASSGMGWASAQQLAQEGWDLILLYRCRRSEALQVEQHWQEWREDGKRIWAYNLDATRVETLAKVLGEAQENGLQVNLLLHSLAKGNLKPIIPSSSEQEGRSLSVEDFQLTLQAMALNYQYWASELQRKSLLAPQACLLALTSEGARRAWPYYGAVAAAKASLEAINRQLALELGPYGHRANVIQPGVTDTAALRQIPGSDKLLAQSKKRNPSGRLTTAQDVARVVKWLSTAEAAWINGAIIPVDGGESIT